MDLIYLDYNATTPLDPLVADAMRPYLDGLFGNPSSLHEYGQQAARAVIQARRELASMLNAHPDEIVFTGGGTESNNYAIKGAAYANRSRGNHLIISSVEHPAVAEVARYLEGEGFEVTRVGVDAYGVVDPGEIAKAIRDETILISVMHANNETGSIQPIAAISRIAREAGVLMHTDAAQSTGKIPVDVKELGVDLLSVAGHKLYAPKGVGALYIRRGVRLTKLLHGADHEANRRAGTENVLEIVGLGKAAELVKSLQNEVRSEYHGTPSPNHNTDLQHLRDLLHAGIFEAIPEVRLNGHPEQRLPNTLSLGFPGVEANTLLQAMQGVAASAGAACHSGEEGASGVLVAMHVPSEYAMGAIRFSLGRMTTKEEIRRAIPIIVEAYRKTSGPADQRTGGQEDKRTSGQADRRTGELPKEEGHRTKDEIQNPASGILHPASVIAHPAFRIPHPASPIPHLPSPIRLTQFTHSLGCACKIRPQILEEVLRSLPVVEDPKVLVGSETSDDAAVYRLNDTQALVQTIDVIPPVVDDPYSYGMIAAANALGDVYAMGGKPIYALNIVGFPDNRLPVEVLHEILRGASDKVAEAGIPIVGGHSVELTEPLFGLSVTGVVDPSKVLRNRGAHAGDILVLTKPIGSGILTTAMKRGLLDPNQTVEVTQTMAELNRTTAEVMSRYVVHACTDVTGFGLLGHLREMIAGEMLDVRLRSSQVPLFEGVEELAAQGVIPGGTRNNLDYVTPNVSWHETIPEMQKMILCDAQTSGGLLIAADDHDSMALITTLQESGVPYATMIGTFVPGNGMIIIES